MSGVVQRDVGGMVELMREGGKTCEPSVWSGLSSGLGRLTWTPTLGRLFVTTTVVATISALHDKTFVAFQ